MKVRNEWDEKAATKQTLRDWLAGSTEMRNSPRVSFKALLSFSVVRVHKVAVVAAEQQRPIP
jgi:hypothetical protein